VWRGISSEELDPLSSLLDMFSQTSGVYGELVRKSREQLVQVVASNHTLLEEEASI
jgi:hypothetical protein